jgi:hypothetical protein
MLYVSLMYSMHAVVSAEWQPAEESIKRENAGTRQELNIFNL